MYQRLTKLARVSQWSSILHIVFVIGVRTVYCTCTGMYMYMCIGHVHEPLQMRNNTHRSKSAHTCTCTYIHFKLSVTHRATHVQVLTWRYWYRARVPVAARACTRRTAWGRLSWRRSSAPATGRAPAGSRRHAAGCPPVTSQRTRETLEYCHHTYTSSSIRIYNQMPHDYTMTLSYATDIDHSYLCCTVRVNDIVT